MRFARSSWLPPVSGAVWSRVSRGPASPAVTMVQSADTCVIHSGFDCFSGAVRLSSKVVTNQYDIYSDGKNIVEVVIPILEEYKVS